MSDHSIDTSYEPYSREPEYIEANRAFVQQLPLEGVRNVLDLACGTGTISELLMERQRGLTMFGLDLSRESLTLGKKDFLAAGMQLESEFVLTDAQGTRLVLIEGSADELPLADAWADLVFMGNSIHMLPDYDKLLKEIRRVMKPGGVFAFNSAFYAGTQAPGTDAFYRMWWSNALKYVLDKDAALRAAGQPGIPRKRGTPRGRPWTSKEEWQQMLGDHGFDVYSVYERPVHMTQSSLQTIGSYSGLARLALSGYPVELASEALVVSVGPAMKEAGLDTVPRLWLEMAARKT